jgi:hypothetical protein
VLWAVQAEPVVRMRALVPVATVACGRGIGMAVCPALGLLFTSDDIDNTLSAFALAAPGMPALGTWGRKKSGPLEFEFMCEGWSSGMLCFAGEFDGLGSGAGGGGGGGGGSGSGGGGGGGPFLLVTDAGNDRVVELEVGGVITGRPPVQRCTFGGGAGCAPRGVAACGALIAVSGWSKGGSGDHVVTLHSAVSKAVVRRVGAGRRMGAGDGQLNCPTGLCFAGGGAQVVVADRGNIRVCAFDVASGDFVDHVATMGAHRLNCPYGVAGVAGGVVITDMRNHRLVCVRSDGSPATVFGKYGSGPGDFNYPTAVCVAPDGRVFVRDWYNLRVVVLGYAVVDDSPLL